MSKVIADRKHLIVVVFCDGEFLDKEVIHKALDSYLPDDAQWSIQDNIKDTYTTMIDPNCNYESFIWGVNNGL